MSDTIVGILLNGKDNTKAAFASFSRNMDGLQGKLDGLTGRFAKITAVGAAIGIGLSALQNVKAISVLDQLDELAEKTGITVEKLGELRYISEVAGTPMEALTGGIGRLGKKMAEAASGNKEAMATFDALGVKVKNADGTLRGQDEVLGDMAEKFAQWEDGAAKAAWAQEFFGKSGADLIPILNLGRTGIERLRNEAREMGVTFDGDVAKAAATFNDNLKKLELASEAASIAIAGPLVQSLADVSTRLVEARRQGDLFSEVLKTYQGAMKYDFLGLPGKAGNAIADYIRGPQAAGGRGFINPALPASTPAATVAPPKLPGGGGGGGAKSATDDPTKKLLDNQLKAWQTTIAEQAELLQQRNKFLDLYNNQGLLSIQAYFDGQRAAQDEATAAQVKAYDDQIAALRAYQAQLPKGKDTERADAEGKVNDLLAKQSKLQREAGISGIEMGFKQEQAQQDLERSVQDVNAQLLELRGNLTAAAAIRFDAQTDKLRRTFSANGLDTGVLDTLKQASVAQAGLNKLSQDFSLLQGDLSISEERLQIARDTGTMGEIDSLRRSGEERRRILGLMQQQYDQFVRLQQVSQLTPEQLQNFQRLQLQMEQLNATVDPLAAKFDTLLQDKFGTFLADITSGAKSGKAAIKDLGNSIFQELNRVIMADLGKDLARSLFGALAGGGGGAGGTAGGFLSLLLGGSSGSSGSGAFDIFSKLANSFSGFFAAGGEIPAGNWGIAGERGAELITGPATVTPLHKLGGGRSVSMVNHFSFSGPADKRTQEQVASRVYQATQRAIGRGTA